MICFRDMSFCRAKDCCNFNACPRALTKAVIKDAEKWWGKEGAPISVISPPEHCYNIPFDDEDNPPQRP